MGRQQLARRRRSLIVLGIFLLSLILAGATFWLTLPSVSWLKTKNPKQTALMTYHRLWAKHQCKAIILHWKWRPLARISPSLIQAVLIAEDDKFFQHEGFDWEALQKAMEYNIQKGGIRRGGSTITQQLAKNLFLSPGQSLWRKLREAAITFKLDKSLSKKRILELYLNVCEWGKNIYGAEAAANAYFQVPAAALSAAQAIRLASVMPNPHRFSPRSNASGRMNRKRQIIARRMLQRGWISASVYSQFLQEIKGS